MRGGRDWNLLEKYSGTNEHLVDLMIGFVKKDLANASFKSEYLLRENLYHGLRNNIHGTLTINGFSIQFHGSLMNSNDSILSTSFLRHRMEISRQFRYAVLGIREEAEQNRWRILTNDSLLNNSFRYQQYEVFLASPDTSKSRILMNYRNRRDWLPGNNMLDLATTANDLSIGIQLKANPLNRLNILFTYRSLNLNDTLLTGTTTDKSLLGRLEHTLSAFNGTISTSTFYEIGSGLESKKEFTYLEVKPGHGVYTWTDYNRNNVRELDEFEIAKFQDQAGYIRVFTPTRDVVEVYTNQFNQSFRFEPAGLWKNKTGLKTVISKFSDQFAFRVDRKNTTKNLLININPFGLSLNNPDLITISTSVRNNFSFNRTSPVFGVDYIFQKNVNRILLANGFDTRSFLSNGLRFRWSVGTNLTFINQSDAGSKSYESEFFKLKDFHISFARSDFSFEYQPGISQRIIANYTFSDEKNGNDEEHASKHDIGIEIRYSILRKGVVTGKINYIKVDYNNDPYTPVAYEMLHGLQPGHNGIWSLLFQRILSAGVEINLEYSGRVFENIKVIHLGSIQVRWNF